MNLAELREAAQWRIAEISDAFFEPPMWNRWLNDAQIEFARETKLIQRISETDVTAGEQVYPIDPDFFLVNVVRFGNEPTLRPISPYELESMSTASGTPTRYLVTGRRIMLWPTPSSDGKLIVWYYASPVRMQQDHEEPEIPTVYHPSLVPGACFRALRADKDYAGADRFEREWQEQMQAAIRQQQEQQEQFAVVRDAAGYGGFLDPWLD